MKESVAVAKEADAKKGVSPTNSIIPRVRDEPVMQLGSLRGVIGNIRRDGGTPSVDSIAANLSSMHTAQRAPALLALQQTHGNRYVQRVVSGIQAKLKIGQPGDIYEQEADRVADMVMRMPEAHAQRQLADESVQPKLKRTTEYFIPHQEEEEEEELIQTKPLAEQIMPSVQGQVEEEEELQAKELSGQTSEISPNLEARINTIRGGGQPLPASTRTFFEPRFGYDFSQVRVHTDAEGDMLNRVLNARAFTTGQDIFFRQGEYNPSSLSGREILAHELTHVVQQHGGFLKIQQRVASDYNVIEDNLSYGILDWAITDGEAREVLQILNGLSQDDLRDTVHQMRRDEILSRLFGNVSDSDRTRFADLLDRIREIEEELAGLPDCCKEALRTIDRMISSGRALRALLGTAPFITLVGEHPAHGAIQALTANGDLCAQAVMSVDPIVKSRVSTVITLHLLEHQNTPEEEFWRRMEALWR
jgi:hypothetical protein